MKFSIASANLVGQPSDAHITLSFEYVPESMSLKKTRGCISAIISIDKEADTSEQLIVARELIARLKNDYYKETDKKAFNALRDSVNNICDMFGPDRIEVAAVAIVEDVIYTSAYGGAKVFIYRNGSVAEILASGSGSVISASGNPLVDDYITLGTRSFFKRVSVGMLKASIERKHLAKTMELFAPIVSSDENTGKLGVLMIKIDSKDAGAEKYDSGLSKLGKEETSIFEEQRKLKPSYFSKIKNLFPRSVFYVKRRGEDLEKLPKRKRMLVSVGVMLLAILTISIYFGIRQKNIIDRKALYDSKLSEATHKFEEALGLYSIDAQRARELFVESRNEAVELSEQGIEDPLLDELNRKITESEGELLGEYEKSPEIFVDMTLVSDNFIGEQMSLSESEIFILDETGKKIIVTNIETKGSEVFAGPSQLNSAADLATYAGRVYVLEDDGIFEVGDSRNVVIEREWDGKIFPYAYAGNIYLLDTKENEVWRYAATTNGFANKQTWLAADIGVSFKDVLSWTIDGNILTLSTTGKITKYSLGVPQSFIVKGVYPELTQPSRIYTNEELEFIYILEPSSERIVVLQKDGEYKAQYKNNQIGSASQIVVSEKEKKIILLEGSELNYIDIEHL